MAIVQARVGSTRLPGKVMLDLAGEPMLARVINRLQYVRHIDEIVIATSIKRANDPIVDLCEKRHWPYFRGSEDDVLDRYYQAALVYRAEAVVRITSDCPLIDPNLVDRVVAGFIARQPKIDYASNIWPTRTYPRGLDTEVVRLDALERAWRGCLDPSLREHVTLYIRRQPQQFRIWGLANEADLQSFRWAVDTFEDLVLVRRIYDYFGNDRFSWLETLAVLKQHPDWQDINLHVRQKTV